MNGDKAAVISAMMAGMVLVSALLLVGFLRYLAHREMLRLYEREGEARPFLEAQERWRTRRGQLFGVVMAWLGGLVALFCFFGRGRFSAPMFLFGGLLFLAGIAFSNAYARWGRMDQDRLHPPTQEQLQERERTRLRRGHNLGLIILFAGLLLFAVGLICLIMPGDYEFRDALRRYALQITAVGWFAVPVSLWLMLTGSILMIGYGAAGRRWEDRVSPPTPEELSLRLRSRLLRARVSGLLIAALGVVLFGVVLFYKSITGRYHVGIFDLGDALMLLSMLAIFGLRSCDLLGILSRRTAPPGRADALAAAGGANVMSARAAELASWLLAAAASPSKEDAALVARGAGGIRRPSRNWCGDTRPTSIVSPTACCAGARRRRR